MKQLCNWLLLPRSIYYYHPSNEKKGILPSQTTHKLDGTIVTNDFVVEEIKKILSGEFVCYGYQNVTAELKNLGFIINHKKVYRLMDENQLLLGKVIKTQGKREWVKFRKINASKPMEYLCWDIKYVWVPDERKNYYLLSMMDVYTRRILDWIFQSSVRKIDVIKMISRIDLAHGLKGVTVRNDNGSQFIANKVRHYLRTLDAHQEFTHIATPEENSYIEAFHSIFDREVVQRFELASFYEAKLTIKAYMNFYNNRRRHGSLGRIAPMEKWNEYYMSSSPDKPQTAQVSEEMSRVSALQDTCLALDIFEDTANFANRMMNDNKMENSSSNLNSFEKPVQLIGG
jgi:putative transposase